MLSRCGLIGFMVVLLTVRFASAGVMLPDKDSTAVFGSEYGLGFSQGDLYLHTGDSIYVLQEDGAGGQFFSLHMTDIESAFDTGPRRSFEGSFVTSPNGHALVSMGYTDGGVLLVDLVDETMQVVPDFNGDDPDDDIIFSAAGQSDGTFYATWVSRDFDPVDATKVYRIDPVTVDTGLVQDVSPGDNSGGMAFDTAGDLVVGTFVPGDFPPIGTAKYFRIAAAELDQTDPQVTLIGSGSANGNGALAVDMEGNIYFNTTTGIGVLRTDSAQVENLFGDITDPDLFTTPQTTIEALVYDPLSDSLLFAQKIGNHFELVSLPVPEPNTSAVIGMVAVLLFQRRHRKV